MNQELLEQCPEHLRDRLKKRLEQKEHPRSARDRYVNALENFKLFKKDRSHFMHLLLNLKKDAVEDMVHFANQPLEHNLEHNNPALYNFLNEVLPAFKQSNYHQRDYSAIMNYLENKKANKIHQKL